MNIYGLSKTETGNILMMVGLGMMIGGPVSGWLSDKVFRSRKSVVLLGAFCFSIPWILLVVWTDNLPVFVLFSLSFAIGFVDRAVNVVLFASNKELFPKDIVGTSTGLLNMFPFIGGALFPPVMGFIIDRSLSVAPIMTASTSAVAYTMKVAGVPIRGIRTKTGPKVPSRAPAVVSA